MTCRFTFLIALLAIPLLGQKEVLDLPPYDIRDSYGLSAGPSASLEAERANARTYATRAFGTSAADLNVSFNRFGRPRVLLNRFGDLGSVTATTVDEAAREFLTRHWAMFTVAGSDEVVLRAAKPRRIGGLTQVRFKQVINDVAVWGGDIAVALNDKQAVVEVLAGELVAATRLVGQQSLPESDAVILAARYGGAEIPERVEAKASPSSEWRYYSNANFPGSPTTVQLVAFPESAVSARLAYRVFMRTGETAEYELLLSAEDGSLLYRASTAARMASARIWRTSPKDGDRELVDFPDGWLAEDATVTTGNNADVFLDRNDDSEPDDEMLENLEGGRASSETRVFDFPAGDVTSNQSPLDFAAAAVTNVFWTINSAHDYFYALGFDEPAGNFQTDNFGRGGLDGDAVRGASQAGGGAFSLTRPDGQPIEIAVGLFPSDAASFEPNTFFDLSYNAQPIIHEITHAVAKRSVGGPDEVGCLNGVHAGALEEGWSDYFSGSLTNDPVQGSYVASPETGIRRYGYANNPLTFQDLGNEQFEVHNDGEVWGALLWDIRTEFGQDAADQLVMNALPLTPCSPSMPDARDAILIAAGSTAPGEVSQGQGPVIDVPRLWEIFAARGLGYSATGTNNRLFTGIVSYNAAFDVPPADGANRSPRVGARDLGEVEYLSALNYQISVSDPDGDPLAYEMLSGPPGMSVSESGLVRWLVTEFTPPRVAIEITDGKGGRVVHGFTLPVIARLTDGRPIEISGGTGTFGQASFNVPAGSVGVQFQLRGDNGDAEILVLGPTDFGLSQRFGSIETLTFAEPAPGPWLVLVNAAEGYESVRLSASVTRPNDVEVGKQAGPFAGEATGETFYKFSVPDGVDSFTVTTGGGTGDADLFIARGRLPACQTSFAVLVACTHDDFSLRDGNFERIVVPAAEQAAVGKLPARFMAEAGDYFLNLLGFSDYAGISIQVNLDTGNGFASIADGGVVNAADFGETLSPGAIGSIFGSAMGGSGTQASTLPLPVELDGTKVMVGAVEAPLFFVAAGQINFQVPFEAALGAQPISVEYNGVAGSIGQLNLAPNVVGIFGYNRVPEERDPVITHADNSLVTPDSPARPGEVLIVYATGISELDNAPATGAASPGGPFATLRRTAIVELGDYEATVLFAGLTPGLVGLAQFNIQLRADTPTGSPTLPLSIRIGDLTTGSVNLFIAP